MEEWRMAWRLEVVASGHVAMDHGELRPLASREQGGFNWSLVSDMSHTPDTLVLKVSHSRIDG
eukprot:scaffold78383_cov26-Tisochrysis_lutea.AAC.1